MGNLRNIRLQTLLGILVALTFSKASFAGQGNQGSYWYLEGKKQVWTPDLNNATLRIDGQVDVSFLATATVAKTSLIEKVGNSTYVKLALPTDLTDRETYLSGLKKAYPAGKLILSFKDAAGKPVDIDDQLFLSFKQYTTNEDVAKLANQYGLVVTNPRPDYIPAGWNYVYILRQKNFSVDANTVKLSALIYENESARVAFVNPNRVGKPGVGFAPDGGTNDADLDHAWFINNHGQRVTCSPDPGTTGADAKIEDAWGQGYSGEGVVIGVVDFGGFDYNHPEMQGQLLPGWNCINNTPYDAANATYDPTFSGHGMAVAGIIGAKGNNGVGSAGVAYGAKIVPFLVNGQEDAQLVIAMQMAIDPTYNVDVMNFSLGIDHPSDAIRAQIENMANAGRVRYGVSRGVVMVASHGNSGAYDGISPQWPAAYPQIIAVGASTPDDKIKVSNDNWNLSNSPWGSNYGDNMSVMAPGVCIYTTDMTGAQGYVGSDYASFGKTSAASPVVAGVAALVLSKNGGMTWQEVKNAINNNADKVHSDIYNYNEDSEKPGHNRLAGFGRVNAGAALRTTNVGISEQTATVKGQFVAVSPVQKQLTVRYKLEEGQSNVTMMVYDMTGKLMVTHVVARNEEMLTIDVNDYSPGMYFARFMNKEDEVLQTVKFIKLW